ncbi:endonuclease domain-containing protein [Staphylococcus saprophyticus]|uniref:endonuclease domain-containing protein n=1 Tax=Staphylococcus saprophyticus TaxID=29385 RepID=UPI00365CCD18
MVKENRIVESTLKKYKEKYISYFSKYNKHLLDKCGSPIEEMYVATLSYIGELSNLELDIKNQYEVGVDGKKYKVDFYVTANQQYTIENNDGTFVQSREVSLCIECDGHDFHEKTKEQVKRDKQRERNLAKRGFKVIRFTGSEIYQDTQKCVAETLRILESLINKESFRIDEL